MAPFDPVERLLKALIRVQLRSIGWQTIQVEVLGGPSGQKRLDGVATGDW
jgi:hypothetical protein